MRSRPQTSPYNRNLNRYVTVSKPVVASYQIPETMLHSSSNTRSYHHRLICGPQGYTYALGSPNFVGRNVYGTAFASSLVVVRSPGT